jgi:hypothetical protein
MHKQEKIETNIHVIYIYGEAIESHGLPNIWWKSQSPPAPPDQTSLAASMRNKIERDAHKFRR